MASIIQAVVEKVASLFRKKKIKREIVDLSSVLTKKMLKREINEEDHKKLIDSFLSDLGD